MQNMTARNFVTRCIVLKLEILEHPIGIRLRRVVYHGKKFLAAIFSVIDLLAIRPKSLDRVLSLCNFMRKVRSNSTREGR